MFFGLIWYCLLWCVCSPCFCCFVLVSVLFCVGVQCFLVLRGLCPQVGRLSRFEFDVGVVVFCGVGCLYAQILFAVVLLFACVCVFVLGG